MSLNKYVILDYQKNGCKNIAVSLTIDKQQTQDYCALVTLIVTLVVIVIIMHYTGVHTLRVPCPVHQVPSSHQRQQLCSVFSLSLQVMGSRKSLRVFYSQSNSKNLIATVTSKLVFY